MDMPTSTDIHLHVSVDKAAAKKARARRRILQKELMTEGSLVETTLKEMELDPEFNLTAERIKRLGESGVSREERTRRRRALDGIGIPPFHEFLEERSLEAPRKKCEVFQINIGLYCNQACAHCHVESSPRRMEMMDRKTAQQCLEVMANSPSIKTLDITGGAPELNDQFKYLVEGGRALGLEVIDRCNLTVLSEPGQDALGEFLRDHEVRVVASLPCYSETNVNDQRGKGVFDKSISALMQLNDLGYGTDPRLKLDLVYNPAGAFLPPDQAALEDTYKVKLEEEFGIVFDNLLTITNMPIKRFADFLHRNVELEEYMDLLVRNFNPDTVSNLMCSNTVNVRWDGTIFDCDFNQQMGDHMATGAVERGAGAALSVFDVSNTDDLLRHEVYLEAHCFGCTAGAGSS